jgi:hypothetical protein
MSRRDQVRRNRGACEREFGSLSPTLDQVEAFVRRYVALTEAQYIAVVLWVAHAWVLAATATTAYLHVTSPEAESGKSRLLEILELLTPKPMSAVSMTTAVLFRAVHQEAPTLFIDEADNIMGDRDAKRELLGLLNAGYRRGKYAYRMGGGNRDRLEQFEVFCAKAIAGLADLPGTLPTRCLRIDMQRRATTEPIEDFYPDDAEPEAEQVRVALTEWSEAAVDALRRSRPARIGVRDRLEEALRLPMAIAAMAGGHWPERSRDALRELAGASAGTTTSEGMQLLGHIRQVFDERDADELATADLLGHLIELDEAPWRGWWGTDRDGTVVASKGAPRKLSEKLRPYGIRSRDIGSTATRRKGFRRADFEDRWGRYLPSDPAQPPPDSAQSAQTASSRQESDLAIRAPLTLVRGFEGDENGALEPDARIARIEAGVDGGMTNDELEALAEVWIEDELVGE